MNINNGTYAGRLTRDVDLRFAPSGTAIANVGLAINRRRKKGDAWIDEPVYLDVKLFGKRAEAFAAHHTKGSPACFPQCELVYETWEKEGEKRSKLVVHANGFEFCGSKPTRDEYVPTDDNPF